MAQSQDCAYFLPALGSSPTGRGPRQRGKTNPLMRTLLRKIPTGEYYRTLSDWTPDPMEAYDFHAVNPALRFASLARLEEAEIVLGSANGQVTAIPVTRFRDGVCAPPQT